MTNFCKYEKGGDKYRFLVSGLLFSLGIKNHESILFITGSVLNDAHDSIINGKVYRSLSVIHLEQIKSRHKLNGVSNWVNALRRSNNFGPFCL